MCNVWSCENTSPCACKLLASTVLSIFFQHMLLIRHPGDISSYHAITFTSVWICPQHAQLSLRARRRSCLSQFVMHKKDKKHEISARDSRAWCLSPFLPDTSSQNMEDTMSVQCYRSSRHTECVVTALHRCEWLSFFFTFFTGVTISLCVILLNGY